MTSLHKFRDIAKFQNRSGFQARRRDRSHCYLKEEQRRSRPILELMLVTLFCPASLLCFDGLSILSQSKDSSLTYRRGYASLLAPRIRGKIAVIASRAICAGRSSPTIPMLTLIAMPQMYWHIYDTQTRYCECVNAATGVLALLMYENVNDPSALSDKKTATERFLPNTKKASG